MLKSTPRIKLSIDKSEEKFSDNPFLMLILGTGFGYLTNVFTANTTKVDQVCSPTTVVILMLVTMVILMLVMQRARHTENVLRALLSRVENSKVNLIVKPSDISEFAAQQVAITQTIRVVGTARQHAVADRDKVASAYLKACESRLLKKKDKMSYQRITAKKMEQSLEDHLTRLLAAGTSNGHDVAVALVPSLSFSLSYQVFDQRGALIIIDLPSRDNKVDNAAAIWSEDPDVVMSLIAHFDNAWRSCETLRTSAALERALRETGGAASQSSTENIVHSRPAQT